MTENITETVSFLHFCPLNSNKYVKNIPLYVIYRPQDSNIYCSRQVARLMSAGGYLLERSWTQLCKFLLQSFVKET